MNSSPEELVTALEASGWQRIHPLSPLVRAGAVLLGVIAIFAGSLFKSDHGSGEIEGRLVFGGLIAIWGLVSWLVTRWCVEGGDLRIETGLIRRSSLRIPLSQVQAIDIVRPVLARIFGLSELRLRTGGASESSGRLAYLTAKHAEVTRVQLLALSLNHPSNQSRAQPPSNQGLLVRIGVGQLIASIAVSWLMIVIALLIVALVVTAFIAPGAAISIIGSSGAFTLGLLSAVWHRLNGSFRLTVMESRDGFQLHSGLLDTTAETIPHGRIQAVRMVQPLLWRPFGWCKLQVDLAGSQRKGGENRAEAKQLRSVLPVGSREDADRLLRRILPDAPIELIPAPLRVRFKSPLRYHNLAWGRSATVVVTTTGRLARVTSWVPLGKVQSLRLVQGPIQRRLRLATIALDTAGRNLALSVRDRDVGEADRVLLELIDSCRDARLNQRRVYPGAS
ncbi:MAG TPA: PH domain-containing protein [Candidatus Acidoferrales bacterium]|nr:PH domain-containing protein [Candidatus Acidoferrales bacterium]